MSQPADYCAIDFGTSNSSVALPHGDGISLVELEAGETAIPTAVFFSAEDETRLFGRAAVQAYVDGFDGRLMRSIKSILGSDLMDRSTEVGLGVTVKYLDVVIAYLRHIKRVAEKQAGVKLSRAVIGRPVFFVDGDAARDKRAQETMVEAAAVVGFREVAFQFEPIAAALDFERSTTAETLVLVADIGGGTSDFSIVRVGPSRFAKADRQDDILANHGVHVAGTDFDREVNLAAIMPALGFGSPGREQHSVPGSVYFDLSTWHLINTVYAPNRIIELRQMVSMYANKDLHRRLMTVLEKRLGHELAAKAEAAKIAVANEGLAQIDLQSIEAELGATFAEAAQRDALHDKIGKIVAAARETLAMAGLSPDDIGALYFTGGSTALPSLADAIAGCVPNAARVTGNRLTSVVSGLGLFARQRFE